MEGLKNFTPLWFHPFRWKHCNENTGIFQWSFEWDCRGVTIVESYILHLAWPEWKGLKFYNPLWFHPFGRKHRGIAGGSKSEYHKITGNVWVEPWVGLQGANKSAHWNGWEIENPLELYCTHWAHSEDFDQTGRMLVLSGGGSFSIKGAKPQTFSEDCIDVQADLHLCCLHIA